MKNKEVILSKYLTFSLVGRPDGLTIDANTVNYTPPEGTVDNLLVTFVVSDAEGASDEETINVNVGGAALPPSILPIEDLMVTESETLTFNVSLVDDATGVVFSADLSDATGATFDPATGDFAWTPGLDFADHDAGSSFVSVTFTAEREGLVGTRIVNIEVLDLNQPPTAADASLNDFPTTLEDLVASYTYDDPDGDPEGATEIHWLVDGVERLDLKNQSVVPSELTHKREVWSFSVRPHDGRDFGEEVASNVATIENLPPAVSEGGVEPAAGSADQDFFFSILYADPDGDLPPAINVNINGNLFPLGPAPGGLNLVDGTRFEAAIPGAEIGKGDHTFSFEANDGQADATGDTGPHTGPTLENVLPVVGGLGVNGNRGVLQITFELDDPDDESLDVTLEVSGDGGASFAPIDTLSGLSPGPVSFDWDTLASGLGLGDDTDFIVRVAAQDEIGSSESATTAVFVDNEPPVLTGASANRLTANAFGDIDAGTGDLESIDVGATDNVGIERIEVVTPDGPRPMRPEGDNTFTILFDIPENPVAILRAAGATDIDAAALGAGLAFPYHVRAVDRAGNVARVPSEGDFIFRIRDDDAPEAIISPPQLAVSQGTPVKLDGGLSSDNSGRIRRYEWDLFDGDGVRFDPPDRIGRSIRFVPEGSVLVTLRVIDHAGNTDTVSGQINIIDTTPPAAPDVNSFVPAITSSRDVIVSGRSEPRSTVELTFEARGGAALPTVTALANAEGEFSQTLVSLPDGSYRVGGIAKDATGNVSPQSPTVPLIIDTTAAVITAVVEDAIANRRPQIAVTITDAAGLAFVDIRLFEGDTEVPLVGGTRRSLGGGTVATQTIEPARNLIDGIRYTIIIVVRNLAQLRSEASADFLVNLALADVTPPTIGFISPGSLTGSTRPRIEVAFFDGDSGLARTTIEINLIGPDGAPIDLEPATLTSTDIHESGAVTFPASNLAPGEYTLTGQVQDRNANITGSRRTFNILGPPPTANTSSQANRAQTDDGREFVNVSPITIDGVLDLGTLPGGGTVEIFVNGDLATRATIDGGTGNFMANVPVREGENEVVLIVVDAIGQRGAPASPRHIVLDTQPPQIDGLEPVDNAVLRDVNAIRAILRDSRIASPIISGVNPDSIQVLLDGVPLPFDDPSTPEIEGCQYNPLSGRLICNVAEPFADQSTHTLQIQVADGLGNLAEASSTFTIDRSLPDVTVPVISGINPPDGAALNAAALAREDFALRASAYDTESGLEEVQIRLDGEVLRVEVFTARTQLEPGETPDLGSENDTPEESDFLSPEDIGAIAFTPPVPLADGEHLLTIYARDKVGNENTLNSSFTVDASTLIPVLDAIDSPLKSRLVDLVGQAEPEATVTILINGTPFGTAIAPPDGRFNKANLRLIEGENRITALGLDVSGNISEESEPLNLLVDTRAPLIGNPLPEPGSRTTDSGVQMSVEFSDGPTGSRVNPDSLTFVLDGNIPIEDFSIDNSRVTYASPGDLAEGSHFFRVSASDFAGNRATFNSGEFVVDRTPPILARTAPLDGEVISNGGIAITATIEGDDIQTAAMQVFPTAEPENPIPGNNGGEFDPISGRLRFQPIGELAVGEYTVEIDVQDQAGNRTEASFTFRVDTGVADTIPPTIVPRFPAPGQEVSTNSLLAIKFEVLDSDSGADFGALTVEINGVVYNELFSSGAGVLNRETGEVTVFARLDRQQIGGPAGGFAFDPLELGALEDPLELGALEDPLELGALEDPLELGALEDPLELGALEDPLELGALEDPLELGALERPTTLSLGLNSVNITASDSLGNTNSFNFTFDVSLSLPSTPLLGFGEPSAFLVNNIVIEPAVVEAGDEFTIRFNSEPDITVQLDIATLDDTQPDPIDLPLNKITPTPFGVPADAVRYEAVVEVSPDTEIGSGRKVIQLIVTNADGDEETRDVRVEFDNFNVSALEFRTVTSSANQSEAVISGVEINPRPDGKIYTNSPEIPLAGQVGDITGTSTLEVEVFVNGNSMGVVPVDLADGTFRLDRVLLTPGSNTVTAFSRSVSQLQSPVTAPQTVILDQTPPTVEFVNLPTHTSSATLEVTTRFSDNIAATPEFVTLILNGEAEAVATGGDEVITTVELKEGENTLVLSAIDAAGNVSPPVETTVVLDPSQLETAPTDLRAGISFSGTEILLTWDADANAGAYNLYRSEFPISQTGELTAIASNLGGTQFTDINVNAGVTYYYALTSISPAGVEGVRVSDNVNVTILFAPSGGTAAISDGTRFTASARGISGDPTLFTAVSIELPSADVIVPLRGAVDGTARRFAAISQSGSPFTDSFVLPATIALPYPADTAAPEELQVFFLDNET